MDVTSLKKQLMTAAVAFGMMVSFSNQADAQEKVHTVQHGDTLWKISQSYNLSTQDLVQYNNLSSTTIYVGQELSLIAPKSTHTTTYTVKSGDSLYISIIQRSRT